MSKKIDYTGKVFGKLTVIKEDLEKEKQRQSEGKPKGSYWLCECSCEKHTIISVERQIYLSLIVIVGKFWSSLS